MKGKIVGEKDTFDLGPSDAAIVFRQVKEDGKEDSVKIELCIPGYQDNEELLLAEVPGHVVFAIGLTSMVLETSKILRWLVRRKINKMMRHK